MKNKKTILSRINEFALEHPDGFNAEQIMLRLGVQRKSTVNARLSELWDMGLIKPVTSYKVNGRRHLVFAPVTNDVEQDYIVEKRRVLKFQRILKRLKREFPDYVKYIKFKHPNV